MQLIPFPGPYQIEFEENFEPKNDKTTSVFLFLFFLLFFFGELEQMEKNGKKTKLASE